MSNWSIFGDTVAKRASKWYNLKRVITMTAKPLPHDHGHLPLPLQHGMPHTAAFDTAAELLKMMSDTKRIQLFWLLCHCEECVINLSALLEMSSPAVSHHLKLLKTAGLIISRRDGKEVYYTAAKTVRSQVLHEMIEQTMELTCPADEAFGESHTYDSQVQIVGAVHAYLTENLTARPTIEQLATTFHINQTTLKTTFKTVFGQPIATYMTQYRVQRACELLMSTDQPIAQIAVAVGYENQSKFTQVFKRVTGVLPSEYRKRA